MCTGPDESATFLLRVALACLACFKVCCKAVGNDKDRSWPIPRGIQTVLWPLIELRDKSSLFL